MGLHRKHGTCGLRHQKKCKDFLVQLAISSGFRPRRWALPSAGQELNNSTSQKSAFQCGALANILQKRIVQDASFPRRYTTCGMSLLISQQFQECKVLSLGVFVNVNNLLCKQYTRGSKAVVYSVSQEINSPPVAAFGFILNNKYVGYLFFISQIKIGMCIFCLGIKMPCVCFLYMSGY